MEIQVLFEDDWLMCVDKPPGLVVDPSDTQKDNTLADILIEKFNIPLIRGGIVHRLDKDTSGVILVAKTQEALENLQAQFKMRKTRKEYLALVHGWVEKGGVVDAAIGRNPWNREKFAVLQNPTSHRTPTSEVGYREAVTEYETLGKFQISNLFFKLPSAGQSIFNDLNKIQIRKLERMKYNQFTLLNCYPLTGRTHQIRVHLKYKGFPIVSDEKYVGRKMYRLDQRWCSRMFLHAAKIGFYHPGSGEWMEVESKLPEDLKGALEKLDVT